MKLICKFYPKRYNDLVIEIIEKKNLTVLISNLQEAVMKRENFEFTPGIAIAEQYYDGNIKFDEQYLPYILNKNRIVEWNVAYKDISVEDLLRTFESNNILKFDLLIGMGGIRDVIYSIQQLWENFIKVAEPIVLLNDVVDILKKLKTILIKKRCKPQDLITYIYSKNAWNIYELSYQTEIDKENIKNLLKGLGYKWDRKLLLYVKTKKSKNIYNKMINEFNNIK